MVKINKIFRNVCAPTVEETYENAFLKIAQAITRDTYDIPEDFKVYKDGVLMEISDLPYESALDFVSSPEHMRSIDEIIEDVALVMRQDRQEKKKNTRNYKISVHEFYLLGMNKEVFFDPTRHDEFIEIKNFECFYENPRKHLPRFVGDIEIVKDDDYLVIQVNNSNYTRVDFDKYVDALEIFYLFINCKKGNEMDEAWNMEFIPNFCNISDLKELEAFDYTPAEIQKLQERKKEFLRQHTNTLRYQEKEILNDLKQKQWRETTLFDISYDRTQELIDGIKDVTLEDAIKFIKDDYDLIRICFENRIGFTSKIYEDGLEMFVKIIGLGNYKKDVRYFLTYQDCINDLDIFEIDDIIEMLEEAYDDKLEFLGFKEKNENSCYEDYELFNSLLDY